jgi:hypothetical protein
MRPAMPSFARFGAAGASSRLIIPQLVPVTCFVFRPDARLPTPALPAPRWGAETGSHALGLKAAMHMHSAHWHGRSRRCMIKNSSCSQCISSSNALVFSTSGVPELSPAIISHSSTAGFALGCKLHQYDIALVKFWTSTKSRLIFSFFISMQIALGSVQFALQIRHHCEHSTMLSAP